MVTLIRLGHWAGLFTLVSGLIIVAAYALGLESIWRPLPGGSPAHPLTAILFIAGGAAVASIRPMRIPLLALVLLQATALLGLLRVLEAVSGLTWLSFVTPFQATLAREVAEGIPIAWPWNAAAMFVLAGFAFLLRFLGLPKASQTVAALGMASPLISLTGYVYGVAGFHGEMSLTTTIVGLFFTRRFCSAREPASCERSPARGSAAALAGCRSG